MRRPAPDDLRAPAPAAVEDGHRPGDVAAFYRVDPSTLRCRHLRHRLTGSGHTLPRSERPRRAPARADAQRKTLIAREQDAVARAAWRDETASLDPAGLIFLDETSTPTTLTPLRGRSRRGEPVLGRVPRGRCEAFTLVATSTPTGFGPGLQLEGCWTGTPSRRS